MVQLCAKIAAETADGEITVTYENVSATYRLTYDEDMRFAGIYVREEGACDS